MAKNFVSDSEYVYLNREYAEVYIPKDLFSKSEESMSESAIAYEYGTGFMIVGVFYIRFFDNDRTPREEVPLQTFCYPNVIETYPSENSTVKLDLEDTGEEDTYRVLKYYHGDIVMNSVIKKSVRNCEQFMALLTSGRIPRSLSYWDIFHTWEKNFEINDFNPNVPSVVLQGFISEVCRMRDNPQVQFRKAIGKDPNISPREYQALSLNAVSAYSSTMSSLSFERIGEKLTTALIMQKENIKQPISPIEKVVVM